MDQYRELNRRHKQLLEWMAGASQQFLGSPDTPVALYFNGETVGFSDHQGVEVQINELDELQTMRWLKVRWRPPEKMEAGHVDLEDRTYLAVLRRFGTKPMPPFSSNAQSVLKEAWKEAGKRPFDTRIFEYSEVQGDALAEALGELIRAKFLWSNHPARFFQLMPIGRALAEELLGKPMANKAQPMFVDDYSNLTHRNRALMVRIVRLCKTDVVGRRLGQLHFNGRKVMFNLIGEEDATQADIEDLETKGMISVAWTPNRATGQIAPTNEGYLAVLDHFERKLEPLLNAGELSVLGAAFVHVNGKSDVPFVPATVAKYTAGDEKYVSDTLKKLAMLGYAQPYSGATFALLPEGIAYAKWLERPKQNQHQSGGTTIMGNQTTITGHGNAVQVETVNSTQAVNQTWGANANELTALFQAANTLAATLDEPHRTSVTEAVDDLFEEVKAEKPKESKLKSYASIAINGFQKVVASGVQLTDFVQKIENILKPFGITPASIEHLIHKSAH